ncbi:hypothetical protein Ct61P_13789 [Colletotrichum tofieldiae]|nr:hypothetical protein Ct61P_13789 [Colletotrichum tofieldiae]
MQDRLADGVDSDLLWPEYSATLFDLNLLLEGVLHDGEVFKSYGYKQLKDCGLIEKIMVSPKKKTLKNLSEERLSIATVAKDATMIKQHLKSGHNSNMLIIAAAAADDTTTLGLIPDQGAVASDALVIASAFGFEGVVGILLGHGVDVNCNAESGSPLGIAAET